MNMARVIDGIGVIQYTDNSRFVFWQGVELHEFQGFVNTWNIRKPVSQGFIIPVSACAHVDANKCTPFDLQQWGCSIAYPQA